MANTPEQEAKIAKIAEKAAKDAKKAAADALKAEEAAMSVYERILKYKTKILELQAKGEDITSAESEELYKQETLLAKAVSIQEKRIKKSFGTLQLEKELATTYASQESDLSSISKVYKGLTDVQQQSLKTVQTSLSAVQISLVADENKKEILDSTLAGISSLQGLQQKMAEAGPEDVETQKSISAAYDAQTNKLTEAVKIKLAIGQITNEEADALLEAINSQDASLTSAKKYAQITAEQKELAESQIEVYNGIKKSIRGVIATMSQLTSGPAGAFGTILIGAGFAADKLGKNIRSFGGFVDSAQFSALGLSLIFDDAEETAKSLSKEFGGLKDVTFSTQLNTNLMATNMNVSGAEAASIVGSFARMNDGSAETAVNMAKTTSNMAAAAGVPIDQVMRDVAGSTEAFAEYGKDGGMNIAKAAVNAAQLGVSMDSMTKVTDSLLDFETSINSELELGAMLGRNINLDRARALAYEGNIGGAVKETLQSLGGIEAFNKMDIFQKREAAKLLGVSVSEFEKMAANSDKLNDDGTVQVSQFNQITEAIMASATASGGFLKTMGGLVLGAAQMGGSFAQMGMDVKGMASAGLDKIKGLFGGGVPSIPGAPPAPSLPSTPPPPSTLAPQADVGAADKADKMGAADKADKMGKINGVQLIQAAAALLILAAALFVFALAAKEFGDDINWPNVFIGIGALALLGLVAAGLAAIGGPLLAGAGAMLIASAAFLVFGIAAQQVSIGIGMFGDALNKVDVGQMVMFGLALIPLGLGMATFGLLSPLIVLGAIAMTALGTGLLVLGAGLLVVGNGISALSSGIPSIVEQISTLSTINFLPILGLAGALTVLSIALAAVAATGMLALPALLALGLIPGGAAAVMGGGEGESGDRTGELIDEIKGLRADLIAGKIAVNIDGQKVTSNVGKVVSRISSNSYAKV
jgi:hypothetical protein